MTFAYSTTVQATTGFSPFEVIYGRVPNFPFDYPIPCKQPETWNHKLEQKEEIVECIRNEILAVSQ